MEYRRDEQYKWIIHCRLFFHLQIPYASISDFKSYVDYNYHTYIELIRLGTNYIKLNITRSVTASLFPCTDFRIKATFLKGGARLPVAVDVIDHNLMLKMVEIIGNFEDGKLIFKCFNII